MLLSMKRKESYLLRLEIFNNIAENIKNSGIVEKFIKEKYTYDLTKEEKLYLMIHIQRVTENK
mgnify:CR=1 FL=1